jgi:hypothetical protein
MHIHFVGELDDGVSVSSHHAQALLETGQKVSFAPLDGPRREDLRAVDVIHLVTREQLSTQLFRRLVAARVSGIPMVRFWTGRDVLWAERHNPTRSISVALQKLGVLQHCRTDRMANDLATIGIDAAIGPVVDPNLSDRAQPEPFPSQLTALCYLPTRRREFCGGSLIDALIESLPDIRFLILGDSETDYGKHKNVESLGFVENISRTILRSTVVLQPRLDGALSRLSLEALSHGRHVISGRDWPFCHVASSTDDFVRTIRELRHAPSFNLDGREYVCSQYEKRAAVGAMCELLKKMTHRSFSKRRVLGGWLGVAAILRSPQLLTTREFSPPSREDLNDDPTFEAMLEGLTHDACV